MFRGRGRSTEVWNLGHVRRNNHLRQALPPSSFLSFDPRLASYSPKEPLMAAGTGQRPERPGVRVSLACVQCRARHLRCDAATPTCARCEQEGCQCTYVKSRRGNRPRAQQNSSNFISQVSTTEQASLPAFTRQTEDGFNSIRSISSGPSNTNSSFGTPDQVQDTTRQDYDALLDLYFTCFHPSHPCVLPQAFLKRRLQGDASSTQFLLKVLRYIGSFFTTSTTSASLEEQVKSALPRIQDSRNPFDVQALILYATAVYWSNEIETARNLLDLASTNALALGMHLQFFATDYAYGDPVLAESWRRTWWTLYDCDLHMAGANHEPTFPTSAQFVRATVDLPCEEHEYNSGV